MTQAKTYLEQHPTEALAGTDFILRLALDRQLLNLALDQRPPDTPVEELYLDPEPGGIVRVHLAARAPVIGRVERRISLRPTTAVSFPDQPWLTLAIVDGLKFLDKPLINLMRGQLEKRLPRGVELTTDHLRLHVPALLTAAGRQAFVPLLRLLEFRTEANRLLLHLHLKAQP